MIIQKDQEAFKRLDEFISMGGNYRSHGNCSAVAEYNYWCDPHGAREVFKNLGKTIYMVGLGPVLVAVPTIEAPFAKATFIFKLRAVPQDISVITIGTTNFRGFSACGPIVVELSILLLSSTGNRLK